MPEIKIDNTGTQEPEVKSCWELEEETPETCENLEPTENTEPEGNEEPQETDKTEDGEVLEIKYLDNTTGQVIVTEPQEANANFEEYLEQLRQKIRRAGSEIYPLPMSIFQHENMQALKDERDVAIKERNALKKELEDLKADFCTMRTDRDDLRTRLNEKEKECLKLGKDCQSLSDDGSRWYKAYAGLAKRLEEDVPDTAGKAQRIRWDAKMTAILFAVSAVSAGATLAICKLTGARTLQMIAFTVLVPLILTLITRLIGDFLADRDE